MKVTQKHCQNQAEHPAHRYFVTISSRRMGSRWSTEFHCPGRRAELSAREV